MGTRYNITRKDIERMGLAGQIETECLNDYDDTDFYDVLGICGWAFSNARTGDEVFSGPNIFKPELDEIFEEYGVKPEYY